MKNILRWCFKNITQKYPGRILIVALLLSGFSIYISTGLSYDSRMDNLLPKDLPLIKEFNEVVAKTGGSGPLVVVLEGLGQDKAPLVISQLSQRFKKVSGTQYVDSQLPKEFLSLTYKHPSPVYKNAMYYLSKREITYEDILKYNIGYCDQGLYTNRIIIPSYDEDGQLNFFVGRDIFESKMKYRNSPTPKDVVGFELFINWDEPIVLCEGPFDAIAIKRNAIPLFGKTILSNLRRKIIEKKVKQVYISLDRDAILDSIKMVEDFMKNDIDVYFVNLPEKDPSDLGFEKVIPLLKETEKMKFSDLMRYKLNGKVKKSINI